MNRSGVRFPDPAQTPSDQRFDRIPVERTGLVGTYRAIHCRPDGRWILGDLDLRGSRMKDRHVVLLHSTIDGEKWHVQFPRSRDEQPVEGVTVVKRK